MRVCCNWEKDLETLRNASLYLGGWEDYQITCMKNKAYHFEYERQVVSPKSDIKSIVYAKSIVFWACIYACMSFIIIIQSLHDLAILRSQNLLQKLQFSQKFANFHNCRKIPTDFGLRRVPWRHQSKKRLFLSLKKCNEQPAFSSCPISKSYIGQTNRKRKESAQLVWATNCLSAWAGATGCSRSRDTVIHSQVT